MTTQAKPNGQVRKAVTPFRWNTQQVFQLNQTDNNKAHALGSTVSYRIDKYGGLAGILFYLQGTVTLSAPGVLTNLAPWNLVKRFRLTLNNNATTVIDLDGYHCYQLGKIFWDAWAADGGGVYTPNALTFSAGVGAGANTWVIPYFLPVSLNQGSDVLTGMINMQSQTSNLLLEVDLVTAGTDVVSNFTSLSLTGEVFDFIYELRKNTELPPLVLCTSQQKTDNITAVNFTTHEIIPQGDLYQLLSTSIINGVRNSTDITNVQFRAGNSKYNYIMNPRSNLWLYQNYYKKPVDTGILFLDFFHAQELPNMGDFRDLVHTNNFTKLEWLLNVSTAAVLGANNNFFHTVERRIIPLSL